jgi:hypothetical protein
MRAAVCQEEQQWFSSEAMVYVNCMPRRAAFCQEEGNASLKLSIKTLG